MLNIDIMLKYIDIPNPKRLEREPDKIISILTNGNSIENKSDGVFWPFLVYDLWPLS